MVVEGAGAAGLAAILAGQLDEFKDKKYFKLNFDRLHSFIVDYWFTEWFCFCVAEISIRQLSVDVLNVV